MPGKSHRRRMGTVAGRLVGYCKRMGTVAGGLVGYFRRMGTVAGRMVGYFRRMGTVAGGLVGYCKRMGTVAGRLVGYCRRVGTVAGRLVVFKESSCMSTLGMTGNWGPIITSLLLVHASKRLSCLQSSSLLLLRSCSCVVLGINLSTASEGVRAFCAPWRAKEFCDVFICIFCRESQWSQCPRVSSEFLSSWEESEGLSTCSPDEHVHLGEK